MHRLNLSQPTVIIKNGTEVLLDQPLYNVTDEQLLKDNGFFKCWRCKQYFDVAMEHTKYHPKDDGREYCEKHFPG